MAWLTNLVVGMIQRPGITVLASEHAHPQGMYDPTGRGSSPDGDNSSNYDMFVLRNDATVWYYPANTHTAKVFGAIKDGDVITKYTTGDNSDIKTDADPYNEAEAQAQGLESGKGFLDYAEIVGITLGTITLIFVLAAIFGGSGGNQLECRDVSYNDPLPYSMPSDLKVCFCPVYDCGP